MKLSALIILALLTLTGCMPYRFSTPRTEGRVLDADTRQPVAEATVCWKAYPAGKNVTGENGTYLLPPNEKTRWIFILGRPVASKVAGPIQAKATGYQSKSLTTLGGLQDIFLAKKKPEQEE